MPRRALEGIVSTKTEIKALDKFVVGATEHRKADNKDNTALMARDAAAKEID